MKSKVLITYIIFAHTILHQNFWHCIGPILCSRFTRKSISRILCKMRRFICVICTEDKIVFRYRRKKKDHLCECVYQGELKKVLFGRNYLCARALCQFKRIGYKFFLKQNNIVLHGQISCCLFALEFFE